jgi:uroporphyrinogen-III synthase
MAGSEGNLHGARVLVTRPAHQTEVLCTKIEAAGGEAIRFPTLAIADPADRDSLNQALAQAASTDWAIFVSPNAVARGLPCLRAASPSATLRYAAVGAATAYALTKAGIHDVLVPANRFDTEGLLECLPPNEVRGKTILLFRGEGGRTLLADTLTARGARVLHAVCYRRVRPIAETAALARVLKDEVDVIVVTSREGLDNLLAMVPATGHATLRRTALIVTSHRQAEAAQAQGFTGPVIEAANTDDDSIVAALRAWRAGRNSL